MIRFEVCISQTDTANIFYNQPDISMPTFKFLRQSARYSLTSASMPGRNLSDRCVRCLNGFVSMTFRLAVLQSELPLVTRCTMNLGTSLFSSCRQRLRRPMNFWGKAPKSTSKPCWTFKLQHMFCKNGMS